MSEVYTISKLNHFRFGRLYEADVCQLISSSGGIGRRLTVSALELKRKMTKTQQNNTLLLSYLVILQLKRKKTPR